MPSNHTLIVGFKRSPIGHFLGSLSKLSAVQIGSQVAKALLDDAKIDRAAVDEVFVGQVLQAGCGQNPARQVALGAGLPDSISCATINKVCGSGMQATMFADMVIRSGEANLVLAGGMESMSNAPFLVRNMRAGHKFGTTELVDVMQYDGLTNVYDNGGMGVICEETAAKSGVTRAMQDEFAAASHQRAAAADKAGRFAAVRVAISVPRADKPFSTDETIRLDADAGKLAALKPAFSKDGTITAGNSSTISDGAAMLLVANDAACSKYGLTPLARIVAHTTAGLAPRELFMAPVNAIRRVCEKAGWELGKVDLFELNEAFAAQSVANMKALELDHAKVNVDGGAIALGHPIGASGARITGHLIQALKARGLKRGIASACLGGGNAVAIAVEVV